MSHIISIIWLAVWPILIFTIYKLALAAVKRKGFYDDEESDET